ncbi:hypothetical protein SLA2020_274040 [Shorea laevis]
MPPSSSPSSPISHILPAPLYHFRPKSADTADPNPSGTTTRISDFVDHRDSLSFPTQICGPHHLQPKSSGTTTLIGDATRHPLSFSNPNMGPPPPIEASGPETGPSAVYNPSAICTVIFQT